MKIQVIESGTNKPFTNSKIQLQVKGPDSGYLTLTTDGNGYVNLDGKYQGQQIAAANGGNPGQWTAAKEGARLTLTTGGGNNQWTGGQQGQGGKHKETTGGTGGRNK